MRLAIKVNLHLHPARASPHVIRIRASTLKTVIAIQVLDADPKNLMHINEIRAELDLSPIRGLSHNSGISRVMGLLHSDLLR